MIILLAGQRADTVIYVDDTNQAYTKMKRKNETWYMKCKKTRCRGRAVMQVADYDFLHADMVTTKPHDHSPQQYIIEAADSVRRKISEPGFEQELIQEVRNRPAIWDRKNAFYNNRTLHEQAWDEVAATLCCPKGTCKAKWRNMRDVFMKELMKETSKWAYFNHLTFLKEAAVCSVRVKEEHSEDDDHQDDATSETSTPGSHFMDVAESLTAPSPDILSRTRPEPTGLLSTDVAHTDRCAEQSSKKRRVQNSDSHRQPSARYTEEEDVRSESGDEDMLFLRSLAPYFKHLPPVQKLRLRGKIENLIADEIGSYVS